MRAEDLKALAEMKGRDAAPESVAAYFKVMGYSEKEVLAAYETIQPVEKIEKAEPAQVVAMQQKKRSKSHFIIAAILIACLFATIILVFMPGDLPLLPMYVENKTIWKVSSVVKSCSADKAVLEVTNADITGMPITQFSIRENNASCVPPSDLESTGIGAEMTCFGSFKDETTYTLVSNHSIDDGFVCRYQ